MYVCMYRGARYHAIQKEPGTAYSPRNFFLASEKISWAIGSAWLFLNSVVPRPSVHTDIHIKPGVLQSCVIRWVSVSIAIYITPPPAKGAAEAQTGASL